MYIYTYMYIHTYILSGTMEYFAVPNFANGDWRTLFLRFPVFARCVICDSFHSKTTKNRLWPAHTHTRKKNVFK